LWEEKSIAAGEVFLAVKTLTAGKAAGYYEVRHEMLKALNRLCDCSYVSNGHRL